MDYTAGELMVVAAAREIRDGEVVFVGMRLPLLGFLVAKFRHAPEAVGIFENGIIREKPALSPIFTMSDPPNILEATSCTSLFEVMAMLQRGVVDLGFIGGAEVDRFGNLNTTLVWNEERPVRLPGSGGAADIGSLAGRFLIIMSHEKRRFRPQVGYLTSPGYGTGPGWREQVGLPRGGPSKVVTTLGVLQFDAETREMLLVSCHPGVTPEVVRANTGWDLPVSPELTETVPPSREDLEIIRRFDPQGFWTSG